MELSDLSNGSKTLDDALHRRLKNRERQRRYRERKRLKVDSTHAHVTNQESDMQIIPLLTNVTVEQVVTRIHCRRDWKKDARRAHANNEPICNVQPSSGQSLASEDHMPHVPSRTQEAEQTWKREASSVSNVCLNEGEKFRIKRGRRDWKAEARNKK
ncbi:unnamed protein product [Amaranthus hypochondriacus]